MKSRATSRSTPSIRPRQQVAINWKTVEPGRCSCAVSIDLCAAQSSRTYARSLGRTLPVRIFRFFLISISSLVYRLHAGPHSGAYTLNQRVLQIAPLTQHKVAPLTRARSVRVLLCSSRQGTSCFPVQERRNWETLLCWGVKSLAEPVCERSFHKLQLCYGSCCLKASRRSFPLVWCLLQAMRRLTVLMTVPERRVRSPYVYA